MTTINSTASAVNEVLRKFQDSAKPSAPNKPLNEWQIRALWNKETSIAARVAAKKTDFVWSRQRKTQGVVALEFQGAVLRAKYRAAGGAGQLGKAFEAGWEERFDLDVEMSSGEDRGFYERKAVKPKGNKNKITEFSSSSRRTLLDKLMSIEPAAWYNAKFVTLTYHDDWPSPKDAKAHLRALFRRIERYIESKKRGHGYKPAFFWRLEAKPRDSGDRVGEVAPHFHLFLFGCPYIPQPMLLKWWREITKDISITQLDIKRLDSRRKAMNYVAAYTSKKLEAARSGKVLTPEQQKKALLDIALYLYGGGRFWGFEGGDNLPFADCERVVLPLNSVQCRAFIAACEQWHEFLLNRWSVGFRIFDFSDDFGKLLHLLKQCTADYFTAPDPPALPYVSQNYNIPSEWVVLFK